MKIYFDVLKTVPLFFGIEETDLQSLLRCLSAKINHYKVNEIIFSAGDIAEYVGIVLSGEVQITQDDYYGNKNIVALASKGHLFAETFACADIKTLPVSVFAASDSDIMLIDYRKIINTCSNSCIFHSKLIYNMLRIVASKNILLSRKIEFTSKRTTKEKLLAYLSYEAKKAGSNTFIIPFNRQELANYLYVERSAMSKELSKLRDANIIQYNKNNFTLIKNQY